MAVIDFFDQGWMANPNGDAYILDGQGYTFDEVGKLSCQISNALLSTGLPKETKVAVWSLNDPMAWTCVLGIWRAGFTWVPVNPRNSPTDNAELLDAFDCAVLFSQHGFSSVIDPLMSRLPKIKHSICIDGPIGTLQTLSQFVQSQPDVPPHITCCPDDVAMLGATGGTTGRPKGVMNTHRNLQTFVAQYMMEFTYRPGEPVINLAAAPMTHTAGVLSLPASARGGTVVILTHADPAAILEAIEKQRITELFLPPTVIYMLLSHPNVQERDVASLRYFLYGAAPMSVDKLKSAIQVFGPVMTEGYGQMEAFASIAYLAPEDHLVNGRLATDSRLSSCGRPTHMTKVAILDHTNSPVAQGEQGEICVRGDLVMKGYYNAPDVTAETVIDGWLHTGDIGRIDADGFLYLTDRKKDVIITGGFNVYPGEIEQVIWSHPDVQDCAVIGVPDEKWGESVKAVVELTPSADVNPLDLIAICRERLGGVKAPKSIDIVNQLPRSANGKVLKRDVRAMYWKDRERKI